MAAKRLGGISMLFKNFTNENASEKITVKERLAYGCGDFSSNIMYSAVVLYPVSF